MFSLIVILALSHHDLNLIKLTVVVWRVCILLLSVCYFLIYQVDMADTTTSPPAAAGEIDEGLYSRQL